MKKMTLVTVSLVALVVPVITSAASALATSSSNLVTPGLTVSPAIEQLTLKPGQQTASFVSQLTNNTKTKLIVNLSVTDFTALNETGGIVFLPNLTNRPHGLAQWLKPAVNQVVLSAGASQSISISITSTPGLAPGGHYGAVVYRVISSGSITNGNQISNNEEISSLVFLTTGSGSIQSIKLGNVPFGHLVFKIPSSIDLVFTNSGNTQVAPHGLVTIMSADKREVARGIINQQSGLILPGTSRLYVVSLRPTGNIAKLGEYHLVIAYQASELGKIQHYQTGFYLVNEEFLVLVVGIGLLALAAIILLNRKYRTRKARLITNKKTTVQGPGEVKQKDSKKEQKINVKHIQDQD
jgi:hypothetical protein